VLFNTLPWYRQQQGAPPTSRRRRDDSPRLTEGDQRRRHVSLFPLKHTRATPMASYHRNVTRRGGNLSVIRRTEFNRMLLISFFHKTSIYMKTLNSPGGRRRCDLCRAAHLRRLPAGCFPPAAREESVFFRRLPPRHPAAVFSSLRRYFFVVADFLESSPISIKHLKSGYFFVTEKGGAG